MVGLFKHPKRKLKKFMKDGEYVEAIKFGESIESEYFEDSDFMFIMGSIYFILEDPKVALPYFEKSYQLNDSNVDTLTLKTNTHLALEQKDEAITCCKRIIQLDPKNTEAISLLEELENI